MSMGVSIVRGVSTTPRFLPALTITYEMSMSDTGHVLHQYDKRYVAVSRQLKAHSECDS